MCVDMCIDMCIDVCMDMCMHMCMHMYAGMCHEQVMGYCFERIAFDSGR